MEFSTTKQSLTVLSGQCHYCCTIQLLPQHHTDQHSTVINAPAISSLPALYSVDARRPQRPSPTARLPFSSTASNPSQPKARLAVINMTTEIVLPRLMLWWPTIPYPIESNSLQTDIFYFDVHVSQTVQYCQLRMGPLTIDSTTIPKTTSNVRFQPTTEYPTTVASRAGVPSIKKPGWNGLLDLLRFLRLEALRYSY